MLPDEYEAIREQWHKDSGERERDEWERARIVAAICVSPHTTKTIKPRELLPLPWDKAPEPEKPKEPAPPSTKERFAAMLKKL